MTKRLFSNYSKNKAIALSPPTNPDRLFPTSNSDRPTPPTKPDRLSPQTKQRSLPQHPQT
ncbi:MAG: hypothetical protein ACK5L4_10655 [Pseudanabaena sp.]